MTELEKGYVAGIIDGEGSISLTKLHASDKFRAPYIEVTSTTYAILEKLKELYGGTISKVTKKEEHWKQAYKWAISYNKVIELLEDVSDYLLEPKKKTRAKLILNEYKLLTPRNGKYSAEGIQKKLDFEKRFFEIEE